MGKDSPYRLVTGPDVVKTGTHGTVGAEALGGAITHTTKSGVADLAFENDLEALLEVRRFVDFLPASNREAPPWRPTDDPGDRDEASLDTLRSEEHTSELQSLIRTSYAVFCLNKKTSTE